MEKLSSTTGIDELFNQLNILKKNLNEFINYNNEIIDKNSIRPEASNLVEINSKILIEQSTQTDEELIYKYAWEKYFNYFYTHQQEQQQQQQDSQNDVVLTSKSEILDTEGIKKCAEQTLKTSGFIFDTTSGYYYDKNTGYYYDQKNQLYFDYKTGSYYKYDDNTNKLVFHSKIDQKQWSKHKLNNKKNVDEAVCSIDVDADDVEVIEYKKDIEIITLDSDTNDSTDVEMSGFDLASKYAPCIRAIVKESDILTVGSLFIIPFTGGKIGSDPKESLICLEDENINKSHANLTYDGDKKTYLIEDESKNENGIYLNDKLLKKNKKYEIKHGDILKLSNTKILLHIHSGVNTCINCEPGEIMFKMNKQKDVIIEPSLSASEKEKLRRNRNLEIKKKFGLAKCNYETDVNQSYKDRANERRMQYGIDVSHIESHNQSTAASIHEPLSNDNIGRKLLSKMGWQEGKGLGKSQSGITEPIKVTLRPDKVGLGAINTSLPLTSDESKKKKFLTWNKTNQRYNKLTKPVGELSSNKIWDIDDDDDDDADNVDNNDNDNKKAKN